MLLLNMIFIYKNIKKFINKTYNYDFSEFEKNIFKKLDDFSKIASEKLESIDPRYKNIFNIENDETDEIINQTQNKYNNILNLMKKINCNKIYKYILYNLNDFDEDENDYEVVNNISQYCIDNKVTLFIYGKNKKNNNININDDLIKYISPYNFSTTMFGYLKILEKVSEEPCKIEIKQDDLIKLLINHNSISEKNIIYLEKKDIIF